MDHIWPRILGGSDERTNLRPLCVPCHKATTARLVRYIARRKYLKQAHFPHTWMP